MIRIGKLTDYAFLITNYLVLKQNHLCTIDDICQATSIPLATNRKLLKKLVDAKVVTSYRGSKGGYTLAKTAEEISLADVIYAVEGPISLTECAKQSTECKLSNCCELQSNWAFLNNFFEINLQKVSLKAMSSKLSEQRLELSSIS